MARSSIIARVVSSAKGSPTPVPDKAASARKRSSRERSSLSLPSSAILDVAPEISALTAETVPISETVSAPVFAKRSAQSRVGIRNGQTIVIGGLMEDRITDTVNKVPFLGDVPGLGFFFRSKGRTDNKDELLIFVTPKILREGAEIY